MARSVIVDPRAVPVVGVDADLPAVDAQQLTAAALKARFLAPPSWQTEFPGDGRLVDREPTAAAVLIALVQRPSGLQVLLTLRTDHLRDHPGQISFPGGRAELQDADAVDTALRETEEEVGLPRRHVDVIGRLPTYTTVTNFVVTPVVALVDAGSTVLPHPMEVAEVFEVPLQFLMTPANHQRHAIEFDGARRTFISMPWRSASTSGEYFIWGATAAMLRNLYRFLRA